MECCVWLALFITRQITFLQPIDSVHYFCHCILKHCRLSDITTPSTRHLNTPVHTYSCSLLQTMPDTWSSVTILLTNHWSGSCKRDHLCCTEFVISYSTAGYPVCPCLIFSAARRPVSMRWFRLSHVQKASLCSKQHCKMTTGWDNSVGIPTRYGLGGPGIESR